MLIWLKNQRKVRYRTFQLSEEPRRSVAALGPVVGAAEAEEVDIGPLAVRRPADAAPLLLLPAGHEDRLGVEQVAPGRNFCFGRSLRGVGSKSDIWSCAENMLIYCYIFFVNNARSGAPSSSIESKRLEAPENAADYKFGNTLQ